MNTAPAPSETAAPETAPLREFVVPFTIDGLVPVTAATPWEAQRKFECMSLQQIAEHGEFWAGEPELKTKEAADG